MGKRELFRVNVSLSKIRKAARTLLTLPEKDPQRIFREKALLRRMLNYALLDEDKQQLDYVLSLTIEDLLKRRLQTLVFEKKLAHSIHQARVLIRQRHIRVGKQIVNVPSFMVRAESLEQIDFSIKSPFGGGPHGRVKRKRVAKDKNEDK